MEKHTNRVALEDLWHEALTVYREDGLEQRLKTEWPGDLNVTDRITYDYPPTFQPGYVGPRYFECRHRIVLLGQNPGEGSDPRSQRMNHSYLAKLREFARGETTFAEANDLIGSHMLKWDVFRDKGIFREGGADRVSLLPEDLRPSIFEVGYVNYFPFKVARRYRYPLRTLFLKCVWLTYVLRTLRLLEPSFIVRFSSSDSVRADLEILPGPPAVCRPMHPSDYNLKAWYWNLVGSWESVSEYFRSANA